MLIELIIGGARDRNREDIEKQKTLLKTKENELWAVEETVQSTNEKF